MQKKLLIEYNKYLSKGFTKISYDDFCKYYIECNDIDLVENTYNYYIDGYISDDINGIFDCFINKGLLADNISNLILGKGYISFKDIMEEKTIFTNENLFNNTLKYLLLQIERKNLKVRVRKKGNKYLEYTFQNKDLFINSFREKYLNSKNKEEFINYNVEIALIDSDWLT